MRMLMLARIDTEKGNQAIANGTMPKLMQTILAELKPEAAYFGPLDGRRTAFLFFDLQKVSDLPRLAEPFFGELGADCTVMPVMNAEDLTAGISRMK
ncbi:hypothetical protein HUT18_23235 [Streptomyces sp. NA04227]|uniref:hypothetical protein n=1 Tax=Streptomyces sp. NA04227 TaxID=2742136 RepID=UPI0015900F66|nr:hypothetical protein [Streptomyces sp. NA04227]QKW08859.1 hypothetical protein HUT18_23235 [Streptomyces sp. NA04227]